MYLPYFALITKRDKTFGGEGKVFIRCIWIQVIPTSSLKVVELCIDIRNDAFGPVRFRVILNIKKFMETILNMPVRQSILWG